ncbi:MAG: 4Fe-4S binding protein [Elusimicrobiales bacterium]|nr:4Fe-4S binding protein [Elusimicrobiales bacterium]
MTKKPLRLLPEALRQLRKKPATVKYPFEKANLYPGFRGRIIFDTSKCIGCKMCIRVCPAKAIEIIQIGEEVKTLEDGKQIITKKFECIMNLDRCIYCAQCVESCPKKALTATQDFELAQLDRKKLKLNYK